MKKTNILKIAFTLVFAFVITGASAQILTDYILTAAGVESEDSVTVNSTTRLYAYPDAVFSPTYDAATNANLGATAQWTWYNSADGSGGAIKAAANENWIEMTHGAAPVTYPVSVEESNTAGGCVGAVTTVNVEIIAEPTVIPTVADGTPIFGSAGSPFTFCETDARLGTDNAQATMSSAIIGNPSFQLQYTLEVDTNMNGDATWQNIPAMTQTYSGAAGTQQAAATTGSTTHDLTLPAGGFVCVTNVVDYPTRFTYTITGINDRISRKSNYLTNSAQAATGWSWYDTTDLETIVITVNPTPVTGPIYHISNMWEL